MAQETAEDPTEPLKESGEESSSFDDKSESSQSTPKTSVPSTARNRGRSDIFLQQDRLLSGKRLGVVVKDDAINVESIKRQQRRRQIWQAVVKAAGGLVENRFFSTFSVTLTIWALLADDVRLGFTRPNTDMFFNVMAIICLVFFSFEILISCFGKPDYFLSFFFALDIIATMSLVLDLTWVSDEVMNSESGGAGGKEARGGRTARIGASVGRMVRVLRLVRIVKLYKAYFDRLQKAAKGNEEEATDPGDDMAFWAESDVVKEEEVRESLVGQKLTSLTIRKVIIMVLVMLMVLPQLSVDTLERTPRSPSWGVDSVNKAFNSLRREPANATMYRGTFDQELLRYIYYHNWFDQEDLDGAGGFTTHLFWFGLAGHNREEVRQAAEQAPPSGEVVSGWEWSISQQDYYYRLHQMPTQVSNRLSQPWDTECEWKSEWGNLVMLGKSLLSVKVDGVLDYTIDCPFRQGDSDSNYLRNQEVTPYWPLLLPVDELRRMHFVAFFDLRPYQRATSEYSMLTTTFICFVLCIGSLVFSRDANELVLNPLEQMMHKVNTIRDNPLIAMKMADEEYRNEEKARLKQREMEKARSHDHRFVAAMKATTSQMCGQGGGVKKQDVLETAILEKTIIKLGSLLALGFGEAGVTIVSSNMSSAMAGVNAMTPGTRVDCFIGTAKVREFSSVTQVLQGKVLTFVNQVAEIVHGIVDQYHGAANKNNGDTFLLIWRTQQTSNATDPVDHESMTKLADMSVIAFVTILSAVQRSRVLARYRGHPGLQLRLGSDCRVALTFGLHFGWAIEGAVGSEFKIDASYLSPTVSVAESCERATKVYGVSMIVSKAVISQCSKELTLECRLIDNVYVKGSKEPIELYTVDLDLHALAVEPKAILKSGWNVKQRFRARQLLEVEKKRKLGSDYQVASMFASDDHIAAMREIYTTEFLQTFSMGYRNYAEGEWQVARRLLERTLKMLTPAACTSAIELSSTGAARPRQFEPDGPSRALLNFMEDTHCFKAPHGWKGVRELEDDTAL